MRKSQALAVAFLICAGSLVGADPSMAQSAPDEREGHGSVELAWERLDWYPMVTA